MVSIYELLTGQTVSGVKVEDLSTATGRTYVDKTGSPEFWAQVLMVSKAMDVSRTYPHGIPIPESGNVATSTIADSASAAILPTGSTEVWREENIDADSCSVAITDGSTVTTLDLDKNAPPFFITKTLYFLFSNGTGSEKTPGVAYTKVSL